jgi:hypothetical protein
MAESFDLSIIGEFRDHAPVLEDQPRPDALLPLASTANSAPRLNPAAIQPSRPTAPSAITSAPTAAPS